MNHPKPLRWFLHMFGVRYWRKSEIDRAYLEAEGLMRYFEDREKVQEAMKVALKKMMPSAVEAGEDEEFWDRQSDQLTTDLLQHLSKETK